jgi:hypothetical protein
MEHGIFIRRVTQVQARYPSWEEEKAFPGILPQISF